MLKLNKDYKGNDLEKQFDLGNVGDTPQLWSDVQDEVNKAVMAQVDDAEGQEDPDFDATECLDIFFKHFKTQQLQDQALLQFVVRDIQERVKHYANMPERKKLMSLIKDKLSQNFDDADIL